jgi:hypothetical protein
MPRKNETPSMFDVEGKEPPKEKAPTLSQWLKERKEDELYPVHSEVSVIWFPGKWNNYNLECVAFRVTIGERHPLYTPVDKGIIRFTDEGTGLIVRVTDSDGTIGLAQSAIYGTWERLGNAGIKFVPVR